MADAPVSHTTSRVIEAYGGGGFRVDGAIYRGSILILPDGVLPWAVPDFAGASLETLQPVVARAGAVDILLIGCGPRFLMADPGLRRALAGSGIAVDAMDTGAACRTYNVLRAEGRRVAAALIAVG
jgi:uncharacterized protein